MLLLKERADASIFLIFQKRHSQTSALYKYYTLQKYYIMSYFLQHIYRFKLKKTGAHSEALLTTSVAPRCRLRQSWIRAHEYAFGHK